jgi:hypothetical protein
MDDRERDKILADEISQLRFGIRWLKGILLAEVE